MLKELKTRIFCTRKLLRGNTRVLKKLHNSLVDRRFNSFWRQKATPELKKSMPQKNLALTFFLGTCLHKWKSRRKRAKKVHTLPGVVQKSNATAVFLPVKWLHKQVKRWMIRAGLRYFPNQKALIKIHVHSHLFNHAFCSFDNFFVILSPIKNNWHLSMK